MLRASSLLILAGLVAGSPAAAQDARVPAPPRAVPGPAPLGPLPLPAVASPPTPAPALAADRDGDPFFTTRDAWIALAFAAGTVAMAPLDRALATALQDSTLQAHDVMRGLAAGLRWMGFPGSAIIGTSMYAVGRVGGMPRVAAIGLHGAEAIVLSYAFVWTGKHVLGRARPEVNVDDPFDFELGRGFREGSRYESFPSGHTAAAFAAAAAVTVETLELWPAARPIAGPVLYAGATLVGVSRMYHNRHWASDAVAGAAIGTFSGLKVVRYHYRNPDNRLDRWLLPRAAVPTEAGYLFLWSVPL